MSDLTKLHRSELEAMVVDMAKTCERYRVSVGSIVLGIEDEGDRAYFGSTNDAEELRDIKQELAEPGNYIACPWMHGTDLYADLRKLRMQKDALTNALVEVEKHFGSFADITINGQHDPDDVRVVALIRTTIAQVSA